MKHIVFVSILVMAFMSQPVLALFPRAEFDKPLHPEIRDTERWDLLVVKFREGTVVRLRGDTFISYADADLTALERILATYPDTRLARLFNRHEADYEHEKREGEIRTGRQLADLNLYYAFGSQDRETAEQLLYDLNKLDVIECVYPEPIPELAFIQTEPVELLPPDYTAFQAYLGPSPTGVDVEAAWGLPGGRGQNVQMIDVELGWAWTHIDLPEPFYQGGIPDPSQSYRNHGTAVVGIIAGIENDYGVTGIAPDTSVGSQAIAIGDWPDNVGSHFDLASAALEPGDVWLIELHGPGPGGQYIPMEWWQANYDAIANSTAQGRICVQAGGNGSSDLDASKYEGKFNRNVRDSLAIMVGAGTPFQMQPEWFTNYGSRMDANGWGSQIYTTGYGDLYSTGGEDYYYTQEFGGTSGASPMVVGVACIAQSIYKELTGGAVLDPESLRAAITETGAPQPNPPTQYIGPRPNLAALLQHEIFHVEGVFLDKQEYSCDSHVELLVRDPDAKRTVTVIVSSTTEPAGETVFLDETEPGVFMAFVSLTSDPPVQGDGFVSVAHGDYLTAEYIPLASHATAEIDCISPVIESITVSRITDTSFTVTWITNEPATSILYYGEGSPTQIVESASLKTHHEITVNDLDQCTHYVFSIAGTDAAGNTGFDDNNGSFHALTTLERLIALDENMDSNPGWIYENLWDWGPASGINGNPSSGYTGTHITGYNLSGNYQNNLPAANMTTTPFDCTEFDGVTLSFYRWLGVESSNWDSAAIHISNDGGTNWHVVWQHSGGTIQDTAWSYYEYDVTTVAAGYSDVRLRWVMGPTDGSVAYCGWNIDDVQVFALKPCDAPSPTPQPTNTPASPTPTPTPDCIHHGDVNMDGLHSAGDAQLAFQIVLGQYTPSYEEECAADCNGDGIVSAADAQQIFLTALGSASCVDPL